MSSVLLPVLAGSEGFSKYLSEIHKFPMLSMDEEYDLAQKWKNSGDIKSAQKLVTSHLKLVAKVAVQFKGYGLPLLDLISEGNIGLMKAVKKFEPDLGYRLSTYAIWWIKASIQDYILKSWSMIKIGTSAMQKKLFFNIKKVKNKLIQLHHHTGRGGDYDAEVASELGVDVKQIESMNNRMVNHSISIDDETADNDEFGSRSAVSLFDESHEADVIAKFDRIAHVSKLTAALATLDDRERFIIDNRRMKEEPLTLDKLSKLYNVSKERIRQIEECAIGKLKKAMVPVEG